MRRRADDDPDMMPVAERLDPGAWRRLVEHAEESNYTTRGRRREKEEGHASSVPKAVPTAQFTRFQVDRRARRYRASAGTPEESPVSEPDDDTAT